MPTIISAEESYSSTYQLDLNSATLEQIKKLPINEQQAIEIWEFREYREWFTSVYQIRQLSSFDQETFLKVKPLVKISLPPLPDAEIARMTEVYRSIESWGTSDESSSGTMADEWIDLAKSPMNVNTATFRELTNLQNVSPVDAVALLKNRDRLGGFTSVRELRRSPGCSYWGYRNARTFLTYNDPDEIDWQLRGDYQFRSYNTPYGDDYNDDYDNWIAKIKDKKHYYPYYMSHKLRFRTMSDRLKLGMATYYNMYETDPYYKGYISFGNMKSGNFALERMILGHYRVTFGQGIMMQNADYFKPRSSGFGYDKRYQGLLGDVSPAEEFALLGFAFQGSYKAPYGLFRFTTFYSSDKKDAILNDDGSKENELDENDSVNQYIILTPRIDDDLIKYMKEDTLLADNFLPMKDVLEEETYGVSLQYSPYYGNTISFNYYESNYNRHFKRNTSTLVDREDKLITADCEYNNAYPDTIFADAGKFRRFYGFDYQVVLKNISLQGEYVIQDLSGNKNLSGDETANAFVGSAWMQYENLNLLVLYRDYDLNFDNPYNRGFSNYQRYKGTIFEDEYYLTNPIYGLLYDNAVQPQAEKGWYFSARYRISEKITLTGLQYDIFERKSDGTQYNRFVTKLEYRPIFPLRFKIRQKFQTKNDKNKFDVTRYNQNETRFTIPANLSRYDRIEFLYATSTMDWVPRGRLSYTADGSGEHPITGQAREVAQALGTGLTHRFNDRLVVRGWFGIYDGFFWTFEDTEFLALDGNAFRYWVMVSDRISDRMSVRLKYTANYFTPTTYVDVRDYGETTDQIPDVDRAAQENYDAFRLQLDYSW